MTESQVTPGYLWWLLPLLFLGLWLGIGALLAVLSGWTALASRYRASSPPEGARLRGQVGAVGWVNERHVTGLVLSPSGLYLYANPLFRFLRPPLLIPWSAVRHTGSSSWLVWRYEKLDLDGVTTIHVRSKAFTALRPYIGARA